MENSLNTPIDKVVTQEVKPKKSLLPILVILQTAVILFLAGIIIYQNRSYFPFFNQEKESVDSDSERDLSDESTTSPEELEEEKQGNSQNSFNGKFFTAVLPNDWTITEYFDGEGTKKLVAGVKYTGLTGLSIKNGIKEVFSIEAGDGFGMTQCGAYAKFKDFNMTHLTEQEDLQLQVSEKLEILDYTKTEYSEFEFLDTTFRRVNNLYYYDVEEGNSYFEPPCGPTVLALENLEYTRGDKTKGNGYFFGPTKSATLEELKIVDSILESIEFVK